MGGRLRSESTSESRLPKDRKFFQRLHDNIVNETIDNNHQYAGEYSTNFTKVPSQGRAIPQQQQMRGSQSYRRIVENKLPPFGQI